MHFIVGPANGKSKIGSSAEEERARDRKKSAIGSSCGGFRSITEGTETDHGIH
jgi:hypothetical protein